MKSAIEPESEIITVVIADDQLTIRQSLQIQLASAKDIQVIGYADNGITAIKKVAELLPDVIIIDLEMPDMDGITAITQISDRFPQTKSLVFSSHDERQYINQAIIAGAKGYLLKDTATKDLIEAIRQVDRGYFQLGSGLLDKLSLSSTQASLGSIGITERVLWESQLISELESRLSKSIQGLMEYQFHNYAAYPNKIDEQLNFFGGNQGKINAKLKKIELSIYLLLFWQIITMIICLSIL